jgi:hypothetical protein
MLLSENRNVGENHNINIANKFFENVPQGTTVTYQNIIHGEIKRGYDSGNCYFHSIQKVLSFLIFFET